MPTKAYSIKTQQTRRCKMTVIPKINFIIILLTMLIWPLSATAWDTPKVGTYITLEANYPAGNYIRHQYFKGRLTAAKDMLALKDSTFLVKPGLWGNNTISLMSLNFPGYYLRVAASHRHAPTTVMKLLRSMG